MAQNDRSTPFSRLDSFILQSPPPAVMLILVPGVTGNIGKHLITSLTARGHQVRGLGRNASKLDSALYSKLHSFVEMKAYNDIEAIDDACVGVDGIINAYNGSPELLLDAQLILLRAAERAGPGPQRPAVVSSAGAPFCWDPVMSRLRNITRTNSTGSGACPNKVVRTAAWPVEGCGRLWIRPRLTPAPSFGDRCHRFSTIRQTIRW